MNINPLLKQACEIISNSSWTLVLKHASKTTDMSEQLMELVDALVKKYRKPRQL